MLANPKVALEIGQGGESWGSVVIELDEAGAPETTRNFLEYVDAGFYSGAIFHRVIPNFMIQGGGYAAGQKSLPGGRAPIKNEAKTGLKNEKGTIAMARTSDPHSATSQFFINVSDNDFLNHPGQDGWGYCAFGRVVEGMDVVERVEGVETRSNPAMGENSAPVNPPVIMSAARA
ncbi:MAG: peptidylprolyl isomerase [Phycisphaerales bacterium]|nr:peptidylprolyl isomerase [Phycisphaerales bacterium]